MTRTIQQIGPITIPSVLSPVSVPLRGSSRDPGIPMQLGFGVKKRSDAERLEELVNNPLRGQFEEGGGVLEWVTTEGAISKYTGWWLLESVNLDFNEEHFWRSDMDRLHLPVAVNGYFLGSQGQPKVSATHRERVDDYTLAGVAMLAPLYPSLRVEGSGTLVSRVGEGLTMDLRKSSAKTEILRVDSPTKFDVSKTQLRPRLVTTDGLTHYGPTRATNPDGMRLETPFIRITIGYSASNHWLVEGYIAGAWVQLGVLRIRRTSGSPGLVWTIVQQEFRDDEVALTVVNDYDGTPMRVSISQGELGVRFTSSVQMIYQLLSVAEGSPGTATATANYILDDVALGSGAKRFFAKINTPAGESGPSWLVTAAANQTIMFGFQPPTPQADDAVAELAKQFLFERDELLVLE